MTSIVDADLPSPPPPSMHFFQTDSAYTYEHFFADFGPLNLGQLHRFCTSLSKKLASLPPGVTAVHVTSSHGHRRTHSIYLLCCWLILVQRKSVMEAYAPFIGLEPPPVPFRDAAFSVCPYTVSVIDILKGLHKAVSLGHFDYDTFDPDAYDAMDRLENGDCTWIIPGKLMAFSGPQGQRREISPGVFTLAIEEYVPLFKKYGVTAVVRFNKKCYERKVLVNGGINHYDLYYEDGANPTDDIAAKFLKICESERGAVEVHCKAGLGRTGTNIGNYMMKHYKYSANEVIAWTRICRPGSVVGPQQQYEADAEYKYWREGDAIRKEQQIKAGATPSGRIADLAGLTAPSPINFGAPSISPTNVSRLSPSPLTVGGGGRSSPVANAAPGSSAGGLSLPRTISTPPLSSRSSLPANGAGAVATPQPTQARGGGLTVDTSSPPNSPLAPLSPEKDALELQNPQVVHASRNVSTSPIKFRERSKHGLDAGSEQMTATALQSSSQRHMRLDASSADGGSGGASAAASATRTLTRPSSGSGSYQQQAARDLNASPAHFASLAKQKSPTTGGGASSPYASAFEGGGSARKR